MSSYKHIRMYHLVCSHLDTKVILFLFFMVAKSLMEQKFKVDLLVSFYLKHFIYGKSNYFCSWG